MDAANNVIAGKRLEDEIERPAWAPAGAEWVNGLWMANGRVCPAPNTPPPMPPEVRQAILTAEADRLTARSKEGLPAGHFRHGGLIRGPNGQTATRLPGGYIDDGSHLPGYKEKRAARIALIQETQAKLREAIDEFEAAKLRMEEAQAAAFRASNVVVD